MERVAGRRLHVGPGEVDDAAVARVDGQREIAAEALVAEAGVPHEATTAGDDAAGEAVARVDEDAEGIAPQPPSIVAHEHMSLVTSFVACRMAASQEGA